MASEIGTKYIDRTLVRGKEHISTHRDPKVAGLKRDPEYIRSLLKEGKDGRVYTSEDMTIHVPERYKARNLASISGDGVFVLGFFGIVVGETYANLKVASMVRLLPHDTTTEVIDGDSYMVFHFRKGDPVIYTLDLVVRKPISYYIYAEFIGNGRIPWFFNYNDMGDIFTTVNEYAGVDLGHPLVLHMLTSMIARDPNNLTSFYRNIVTSEDDIKNTPPVIVPFKSVVYNTHSTLTKMTGAYFSEAINSALAEPTDKVDRIETLLRT